MKSSVECGAWSVDASRYSRARVHALRYTLKFGLTMAINKFDIHKILLITLSNLGDIILTTPVFEKLHDEFPEAKIDIITGPAGKEIFARHPAVGKIEEHKKHQSLADRARQAMELRLRRYDIVVDLKESLIPYLVGAKHRPSLMPLMFRGQRTGDRGQRMHKRDEHLAKLSGLGMDVFSGARFFLPASDDEREFVNETVSAVHTPKVVVMNPGAKSHLKRWDAAKYAELADRLTAELGVSVFVVGTRDDLDVVGRFMALAKTKVTDLCCGTTIGALAELMRRANLVITNDSAPLHMASAVNAPTVAIFGPTDERKYGPLASKSAVLKPAVPCRPCGKALCAVGPDEGCISRVSVDEVFEAAKRLLEL